MCNTVLSSLLCGEKPMIGQATEQFYFFFCGAVYYAEQGGSNF